MRLWRDQNGPLIFTSLIQLRRSLKMRYQMIDASNYRGLKRLKHLLIPILSQNIRRASIVCCDGI